MTPAYANEMERGRDRERKTGRKGRKIGKRNEIGNCSCATQTDNLHIIDCSPVCTACVCASVYACVCVCVRTVCVCAVIIAG